MLFKDVLGHNNIKRTLINTVKENRISHAQMFLGQEGTGNLAMAIAYAQYICCTDKHEHDACGVCNSCKKFNKLIHPDLHFVFPIGDAKETSDTFLAKWREKVIENPYLNPAQWYAHLGIQNKQGSIHRKESDVIIKKLSMKTYEAEYKTMIIWCPETMNTTSANKLLKILEDPPPKTLFILVASNTDHILPTILSRTQIIKIPRIDDESMQLALKNTFQLDKNETQNIIHLANGNYLTAINLINSDDEYRYNFDMFVQMMRLSYSSKVFEIYQWIDEMTSNGREKLKQYLQYTLRMVRENFITGFNTPSIVYLTDNEKNFSAKFSEFINERNACAITNELNKAFRHIEMNANNKLVFLDLILKLMVLLKK